MSGSRDEEPGPSEQPGRDVESAQPSASQGGWAGRAPGGRKRDPGPGGGPGFGRRVVARGVRRGKIDERTLIEALMMIAKDLEQDGASGSHDAL